MTDKELIKKLIEHYGKCIRKLNDVKDYRKFCRMNNVGLGICGCARQRFKSVIYDKSWVTNHINTDGYWYQLPFSHTKDSVKESLEYRFNKLVDIFETFNEE